MKKQKILVALVCVVFFTAPRGAVAITDEEQIALIPPEWYAPDGYLPEWYQPGYHIPHFSPTEQGTPSIGLGAESNDPALDVPEPGTLVGSISVCVGLLAWAWGIRRRR